MRVCVNRTVLQNWGEHPSKLGPWGAGALTHCNLGIIQQSSSCLFSSFTQQIRIGRPKLIRSPECASRADPPDSELDTGEGRYRGRYQGRYRFTSTFAAGFSMSEANQEPVDSYNLYEQLKQPTTLVRLSGSHSQSE